MGYEAGFRLSQRYEVERGRIILTGVQALVRLPLMRRRLDRAAGLRTAGFISGYRGSPLAGYDLQLAAVSALLTAEDIVVRPAINEDLAATAVWGTQQVNLFPSARFEGVFGIWYGKAPGVDRSGDVFKHANFAGTWAKGGVLAVAGDDHGAKSSSLAAQSDYAFVDAEIPVFAPSSIEEVLEFGIKAFDLSRFAGLWVGMTTVAEIMDGTSSVSLDDLNLRASLPQECQVPPEGLGIRLSDTPLEQERRHRDLRLPAAHSFVRANSFDRLILNPPNARIGLIAAGKAYMNLRQALADLGIDESVASRFGLRIFKPGLVWPLEPAASRAFAEGLESVLVIEERRSLVEDQLKQICYHLADGRRPKISGKQDFYGRPFLPDSGELTAARIIRALLAWLPAQLHTPQMICAKERLQPAPAVSPPLHRRTPYFCSGCPHNTSTRVPEGSRATAGIGCHYLVQQMPRNTATFTQMGGEGVSWMGQAPFTNEQHIFANLGDGTYFHSGILAIRQAIAAGLNITYKILFNDAVAMTGGQAVDGELTVAKLAAQLQAEGVREVIVVSADPTRTAAHGPLPGAVSVAGRDHLDSAQRRLRTVPGVTALIYDQTCATELRRKRKRGLLPDPQIRLLINERVCEGCGDCSAKSNCVSIEPVETLYGRKRRIDQSSCNQDLSCLQGFCPSFVTIQGGRSRTSVDAPRPEIAEPSVSSLTHEPTNVLLCGIGGQGVTSLAAILAAAAHLDGGAAKSVDMLGMAQKGGGVFVHLRFASMPGDIPGPRVELGQADLLIANDMVTAHGPDIAPLLDRFRSHVSLNVNLTPTAEFTLMNDVAFDVDGMLARIGAAAKDVAKLEAARVAEIVLGDRIFAAMILVGHAWQSGCLPLSRKSIEEAIALNGVAPEKTLTAFNLGRLAAADAQAFRAMLPAAPKVPRAFKEIVDALASDLRAYQGQRYAERFEATVRRMAEAERKLRPGSTELTLAAARSLHRLMAYKDEYEVARLYSDPAFLQQLQEAAGSSEIVSLNLAPPLLARRDPLTGEPTKIEFGRWLLRLMPMLARMKWLRETPLDPFGWTSERRTDRALRDQFLEILDEVISLIDRVPFKLLLDLVLAPQSVRGFGHVRAASVMRYRAQLADLRTALSSSPQAEQPSQRALSPLLVEQA